MLALLTHPVFRKLYAAQVVSLIGTGLATVALSLLAFELAGDQAGTVLGTALAIKMIAYVFASPLLQAILGKYPAKNVLISLDLIRVALALCLPFVSQIWQIYALIFLLQSASAGFTPVFQAQVPAILPDEKDYTNALSLSRLTYDLENLVSPTLAALLLGFISFHWLFAGTAMGFAISAIFVYRAVLPAQRNPDKRLFWNRLTNGTKLYLATPRLRGLLGLTFVAAFGSAMVLVNSIVLTRVVLGLEAQSLGAVLATYGAGSMLAALSLPLILGKLHDRAVMFGGAAVMSLALLSAAVIFHLLTSFYALLAIWFVLGWAYSIILTPAGRLLNRSSTPNTRAEVFTAQFALSHACWLVAYPLAGWLVSSLSLFAAFGIFGALSLCFLIAAVLLWPKPSARLHSHDDLPTDHPHLLGATNKQHAHKIILDDLHSRWMPSH